MAACISSPAAACCCGMGLRAQRCSWCRLATTAVVAQAAGAQPFSLYVASQTVTPPTSQLVVMTTSYDCSSQAHQGRRWSHACCCMSSHARAHHLLATWVNPLCKVLPVATQPHIQGLFRHMAAVTCAASSTTDIQQDPGKTPVCCSSDAMAQEAPQEGPEQPPLLVTHHPYMVAADQNLKQAQSVRDASSRGCSRPICPQPHTS
jgi:hypothetical protein